MYRHSQNSEVVAVPPRLGPNKLEQEKIPPLEYAIATRNVPVLEQLLEDERVNCIRPEQGGEIYDTALANVRRKLCARFRGLARAIVVFRRMRLRAAMRAYAPGGTGFLAAAERYKSSLDSNQD